MAPAGTKEAPMAAGADSQFEIRLSRPRVPDERRAELLAEPGFGQVFTDHMVTMSWTAERGWHDGELRPYGPISMDPATQVFHYAQEIFEGLKAYRQAAGPIVAFRPGANASLFIRSAVPMAVPELTAEAFIGAIELVGSPD